jgi:transcriptional regulator GlxA family with amidase domain
MTYLLQIPPRPRNVWFVSFPHAEVLDTAGPWAVFGQANDCVGREVYRLKLVSPAGGTVRTRHALALAGARSLRSLARAPKPDMLIVAGGSPFPPPPGPEREFAVWLRAHQSGIPRVISICTGAFVLGEAGLLDGRNATTHWKFSSELARRFPKARVTSDNIYVRDGRVLTSAGVTSGIDLTLSLVEADLGHEVALAVAQELILFLRRSGHQAQFSGLLERQGGEPSRLRDLTAFVLEHLDEPLSVERLAQRLGLSTRTFARFCRNELEESPAAFVRHVRLDEARRLLAETDLPLKDIAARTGIGDASTLHRSFDDRLGITPAEYRSRFRANHAHR